MGKKSRILTRGKFTNDLLGGGAFVHAGLTRPQPDQPTNQANRSTRFSIFGTRPIRQFWSAFVDGWDTTAKCVIGVARPISARIWKGGLKRTQAGPPRSSMPPRTTTVVPGRSIDRSKQRIWNKTGSGRAAARESPPVQEARLRLVTEQPPPPPPALCFASGPG
jgi:hypothetical protein